MLLDHKEKLQILQNMPVAVWLLWKHENLSITIYYQIVYTEKVSKVSSFLFIVSVGGFQPPGVNVAKLSFSCTLK